MTTRNLIILLLLALVSPVQADQYAFLVGVRDYSLHNELTALKYTEDDVHTLAGTLSKSGVPQENIVLMTQRMAAQKARLSPRSDQIRREFQLLLSELGPNDSIIVGFSGHGLQFKGDPVNYFCPLDAKPTDKSTLISLTEIYDSLNRCKARTKLLLVDACRDDPLTQVAKTTKRIELEPVLDRVPPVLAGGTVAIFSCSASQQSFESPDLQSGVFFHFVNRALAGEADDDGDQAVDLIELEYFTIKSVQKWARVNIGKPQIPERVGRATGAMELVRLDSGRQPAQMNPTKPQLEATAKSITNSIGMTLNLIPAGTFLMGSPPTEEGRDDDETQHRVTLSKDFYIGTTEVTQGQWESVMGTTPWRGQEYVKEGSNVAATFVSWEDAVEFCKKLSAREGKTYRLPTEAEWEYACRAGTTTTFSFGDVVVSLNEFAWWGGLVGDGNSTTEKYAHEVGLKRASAFGLYDMHGNAWEWCSDWQADYPVGSIVDPQGPSTGSYRAVRGGSWIYNASYCRSASRFHSAPDYREGFLGFRVVVGR
ncbi:SUMF1/EgtB/PvdO family nonheme iron enzyme [Stieleria varia]|uniref:Iron(II)-dependent oxidoreductase EgtB n=1 Tax=Stieleria varia TaxID=2528005 RepID=A0A5C6AUQ7_9BACT|nr:SUMF1/EgtB/PvdO family nonheme iron enzyme [Stieleria varia]TWU02752.1 Iron(II)-dependent oxidoreductase EgtB [Stieleria varia]